MKLKELKCKNCGAKLKAEETSDVITCKYCKTTFSINDEYNESYKKTKGALDAANDAYSERLEKIKKEENTPLFIFVKVFIALVFILLITSIGYGFYKTINNPDSFNFKYSNYNGTKTKFFIDGYLDEIITNNKTNKKHKITVVYNSISTTKPEEIIKIKKELEDHKEYEIIIDYDDKGYINKMTIE